MKACTCSRIVMPALVAGSLAVGASSLRAETSASTGAQPAPIILAQAAGNPESPGGPNAQTAAKNADHFFAQNAALSDMVEVTASKLAQQKASAPRVKSFADQMVKDHTQASTRLSTIAKAKGWSLPTQIILPEGATAEPAETRTRGPLLPSSSTVTARPAAVP